MIEKNNKNKKDQIINIIVSIVNIQVNIKVNLAININHKTIVLMINGGKMYKLLFL